MKPCPLRLFLVLVMSFGSDDHILGDKVFKGEQNIGTVVFERSDTGKHCWTSEEFTILNSRRMFQDILPKVKVINCQNDQYIALLMDYFHICLECVRKLSIGKTKHLMLKALADTMGGYLQVYILPLTRHSYYAGNIKYKNAKRLFELFDELKNFLHTNGVGWLKPKPSTKQVKTPPILITPPTSSLSCNGLITYPAPCSGNNDREHHQVNVEGKSYSSSQPRKARNFQFGQVQSGFLGQGAVTVPLPFLDDEAEPNSIALPFKTNNLQSLYCEKSAFVLVKYYVASMKCVESRSETKTELVKFKREMYEWLQRTIHPRLDDEKWYPAFGGVLRVMASLKETGVGTSEGRQGGDYQMMPKAIVMTNPPEVEELPPLYKGKGIGDEDNAVTFGTTELIVIALAGALLVWLLVGLTLVCYRFLTRNSDDCPPCESPLNTPVAVLYENTEYCQPDTCPSKVQKKNIRQKLKDWCKNKCNPCPGGCKNEYGDEERCLAAISYSSKDTIDVTNSNQSSKKKRYKSSKSVSVSQSASPRGCIVSPRTKVCYSSDETTTNSEAGRAKSR